MLTIAITLSFEPDEFEALFKNLGLAAGEATPTAEVQAAIKARLLSAPLLHEIEEATT